MVKELNSCCNNSQSLFSGTLPNVENSEKNCWLKKETRQDG